ncbi:MAG: hypothetical protein AB9917_13800 [Negativicutes bacterium]
MGNGALATTEPKSGGLADLVGVNSGEMAARLLEMSNKITLVRAFMQENMVKGFDYGTIPGAGDKMVLLKPGAEKLCELYGFAAPIKSITRERDYATGFFLAEVVVQIVHRERGILIAEGVGECSSFESKYRYRWYLKSELERQKIDLNGVFCKTFVNNTTKQEYPKYRLENPDLIDQWNTVLKMAKKRALVDAVLAATRSSELFSRTQTELDAWMEEGECPKQDHLEKKKDAPTASDEKATFNPSAGRTEFINTARRNMIIFEAEKKGVKAKDIEDFVWSTKRKVMDPDSKDKPILSRAEAVAVIDWIRAISAEDLTDLIIDAAMDGMGGADK